MSKEKIETTCILFNEFPEEIHLFVVDGDYSVLNGVMINACDQDETLVDQLLGLIYNDAGYHRIPNSSLEDFHASLKKDNSKLIMCGMFL